MLFFLFLFFLWIFITFFKETEKLKILGSWGLKIDIPEINIIHLSSVKIFTKFLQGIRPFALEDKIYFILLLWISLKFLNGN